MLRPGQRGVDVLVGDRLSLNPDLLALDAHLFTARLRPPAQHRL
jgi:hypothetical protein